MRGLVAVFFVFTFVLCLTGESRSTLINGGFETGSLTGWQTIGDVSIQTGSIGVGPTDGSYQVILTNDTFAYDMGRSIALSEYGPTESDAMGWVYPYSGTPAGAVDDAFLGLPEGTIRALTVSPVRIDEPLGAIPGNESAISQTFFANAGDMFSFDWNYLTSDGLNYDFALVSIVSDNLVLTQKLAGNTGIPVPPDAVTSLQTSTTSFANETGFNTFSFLLPASGEYTVGVSVFQVMDSTFDSGVLIDNFRITSVPEPSTMLLLGAGLAGLALGRRRLRR